MINVITIDREYGSGGGDIARKLAERLGWKLWDELLTTEIARIMDCECQAVEKLEESRDPLYHRLFKAFMRGSLEGSQNAQRVRMVDADCIRDAAKKVVLQAAEHGNCVIVGRGSAYHLQSNPAAFHAFVYAPVDERVRRLISRGESEDEAYSLAESIDRDRAAYVKRYFEAEWPNRHIYHLMINSSGGDEAVVDMILDSVAILSRKTATQTRSN
jgi:cytidylate kinase